MPIYEGYAIPHAITEIPICGYDLTKYLHSLLNAKYPAWVPADTEITTDGFDEC